MEMEIFCTLKKHDKHFKNMMFINIYIVSHSVTKHSPLNYN